MNTFSLIFLSALGLSLAVELWLLFRQSRSVRRNQDQVPAAFNEKITLQEHQKAARYTLARIKLTGVKLVFAAIILLGWTLGGGLNAMSFAWSGSGLDTLWWGTGLIVSVMIVGMVLDLPFSLWSTFGIEKEFGFNRSTPGGFFKDMLLQVLLGIVIGTPLLVSILWIMNSLGGYWWIAAWGVWMSFTFLITWAYPVIISPLFNKFEPLKDEQLRQRLEGLLGKCGFRSEGMFVMDGSKRSAHGNAYFTGFGKSKRIVFYDTLLDGLSADQVEAVLAHELGHFKRRHVLKMMLLMSVLSLAGLAILGWLMRQPWFYTGLGVTDKSSAMALLLFVMVLPVFTIFLTPMLSAFSRKNEFEADSYAAAQSSAQALIDGLVSMYRDNASTLTPDSLYSAFYHSHPPASVRIAHLSSKL